MSGATMFDVGTLKAHTDLIALAERDTTLKRKTRRGEMSGPCPFCGGRDRFNVHADKWLCRNCTRGKWQDAIGYVQRRENCDFKTACEYLGAADALPYRARAVAPKSEPTEPTANWQTCARQVIAQCADILWGDAGAKAREWLHARGLNDETLKRWRVGYLPGKPKEYANTAGLSVPCGIVIPCEIADSLWYVKVRRVRGEPKYEHITGGKSALFGAECLEGKRTAILTEGEFDAMLLHQECGDLVGIATMGGATTCPSDAMLGYLLPVSEWLIAYDIDEAGNKGAAWWLERSARARRVYVPKLQASIKDLTDFWKAGGNLREWVKFQIGEGDAVKAATRNGTRDALDRLRAERDVMAAHRTRLLDQAEATPGDADAVLARWETVDAGYKRLQDRVDLAELTEVIRQAA